MEQKIIENYNNNLQKAKNLSERWVKGDRVRVLKNLDENITEVKDYLGKVCEVVKTVRHVPVFGNQPKVEYQLKLGDRIEPFWEEELDARFKSIAS